jgi:aromatic-L-amino-acid decarboxylase
MDFDEIQAKDLGICMAYLQKFWGDYADSRASGNVGPSGFHYNDLEKLIKEPLPQAPQPLEHIFDELDTQVLPNTVKTAHPMFMAYVTPPSLDICALGDAISSILNQNVSFAKLSPAGTAVEGKVINWLCEIAGYSSKSGGVMVSGGSMANLYGLAIARRTIVGDPAIAHGNYADPRPQRIYCSEHIHRSVHKAAMLLGIGAENVCTISADQNHRVNVDEMERKILEEKECGVFLPTTIVGAAGTRVCGAFDDLKRLSELADRYDLWFHVDAAFGGALRLASPRPAELDYLGLADSITFDPHKLLFVPFDSGCLLVRERQHLLDTFAVEGEYLERSRPPGVDYADMGMQLGRSMKALKVWLALKYIGTKRYGEELSKLMDLARYFEELVRKDQDFELLAPVASTVVCFRWRGGEKRYSHLLNDTNQSIPARLRNSGVAFVNQIRINGMDGVRVCMTNFRTQKRHLEALMEAIKKLCSDSMTS